MGRRAAQSRREGCGDPGSGRERNPGTPERRRLNPSKRRMRRDPKGLTLQAQSQRHALILDAVDELTAVPALVLQVHAGDDQGGV